MSEVFRRYPGANPRTDGGPLCAVSHPDAGGPCGRPAVGEVWSVPFCGPHGLEAEYVALSEIQQTTGDTLDGFAAAADHGYPKNPHLAPALAAARVPGLDGFRHDGHEHERLIREAFDPDPARTDPETLAFDYDDGDGPWDGPVDWWSAAVLLAARCVRQADELGLPALRAEYERVRERAAVQLALAADDYERRYRAPRGGWAPAGAPA